MPLEISTIDSDAEVARTSSDEDDPNDNENVPRLEAPPPTSFLLSLFSAASTASDHLDKPPQQQSWDFSSAITQIRSTEHSSQRLTTSLDDKIRRTVEQRRAAVAPAPNEDEEDEESASSQDEDMTRKLAPTTKPTALQPTPSSASFSSLHLSRPLLKAVHALGFAAPTPIQAQAIPVALRGKDILGSAATGSGKTAAYLLPCLERLLLRDRRAGPCTRVLIVVPTRELAQQVASMLDKLGQFADVTKSVVVGGLSLQTQAAELRSRPDVVLCTPGRLIDHLRNTVSFDLADVEILILDEADRLLELGFQPELKELLNFAPRQRQTLLFSATLSADVQALAELSLKDPVRVATDGLYEVSQRLVQEFVRVRPGPGESEERRAEAMLVALCSKTATERTIVFFQRKRQAHRVSILFGLLGLKAAELHGNLTQVQRLEALQRFKDGLVDFLLCTDLAARGLDIANVRWVCNFEMPKDVTTYVHRVGRTARAGKGGRCVTFVAESRRQVMRDLVKSAAGAQADLQSRKIASKSVEKAQARIDGLEPEIAAVLEQERVERQLRLADMETTKALNLVEHGDEIKARPKRTWFQSERDKQRVKDETKAAEPAEGERLPHRLTRDKRRRLEALAREEKQARREHKEQRVEALAKGEKPPPPKPAPAVAQKALAKRFKQTLRKGQQGGDIDDAEPLQLGLEAKRVTRRLMPNDDGGEFDPAARIDKRRRDIDDDAGGGKDDEWKQHQSKKKRSSRPTTGRFHSKARYKRR